MTEVLSGAWWSPAAADLLEAVDIDPEEGLSADRVEEMRQRYGATGGGGGGAGRAPLRRSRSSPSRC